MKDDLMNKLMEEVMKKMNEVEDKETVPSASGVCGLTEFIGTARGNTIGLVIANVDKSLHEAMKIDPKYRSIGILSSRTGAGPQIFAADEAVKATNCEVVGVELSRDTEGGAGHGSLIIFGAEDVSDAKRAVEVALNDLNRTFGDVYANASGHLEFQYTARASFACNFALGAPIGKAFGIVVGAPAGIGVLMADASLKAANIELVGYASPDNGGTKYSNESMIFITGDAGAVRQALYAAREVGKQALEALGGPCPPATTPYI
ncbi:propanediol utilization microcompartment protein PduB [uncultured Acetobacterium sp.]|uniref:propanediol utilization microcompartment protein PduB n=1 Tax=uncultured Acetobacterium sp. TaxID=217139 RepID=UPI0025FF7133|nr:propanediol utilization microcompartment protein PduB [uncultured Acetobacterium sp.]